jgi:hypothetical protein
MFQEMTMRFSFVFRSGKANPASWISLCAATALIMWAGYAQAQTPSRWGLPDPAPTERATNAQSAVPAQLYRSVFADLPKGVENVQDDWAKANAEVGQFRRGHIDLLKWEDEQARQPSAPAAAGPTPNTPAQPSAGHSHAH